jgi:hypothetical protein
VAVTTIALSGFENWWRNMNLWAMSLLMSREALGLLREGRRLGILEVYSRALHYSSMVLG